MGFDLDVMKQIHLCLQQMDRVVLDADISKCFDNINHSRCFFWASAFLMLFWHAWGKELPGSCLLETCSQFLLPITSNVNARGKQFAELLIGSNCVPG